MASSGQKALGGASSGAGIGFAIGGPFGALAGAGLGAIFGGGQGSDPNLVAPTFSDINLEKENPDLFKRLKAQDALISQAQSLYDQRRQSVTANEERMYREYLANASKNVQNSGLAGTSDGLMVQNNAARTYQDQLAERIYKEKLGLFDNLQQASGRGYDMNRQALGDVMGARNAQLGIDENKLSNSNAMWSGLFNGGMQMLGSGINTARMAGVPQLPATYGAMPEGYSYGVPASFPTAPAMGGPTGVAGPMPSPYSPYGPGTGLYR